MSKTYTTALYLFIYSLFLFITLLAGCRPGLISQTTVTTTATGQSSLDVLSRIKTNAILRVGTTGDFTPFSYREISDNLFSGIDIELARDLALSLGVEVQFIQTSWPNLITDLNDSKFDIGMSGITITENRKQTADFSTPVLSSGKVAITGDENVSLFTSIAAINQPGVRVIVNPGGTNEVFAKANFPKATLIENDENLTIFQKIVDGEADLMVTDGMETLVQERIHPELEAVNPKKPFNSFQIGYLIPKDAKFKAYVDKWLQARIADSTLQKIIDMELNRYD
jgi:cyclohexadienyl dehydratase